MGQAAVSAGGWGERDGLRLLTRPQLFKTSLCCKMRQLDDFQHAAGCRQGSQQVQLRAAPQEATHTARNAGQALEVMGQE